VAVTPEDLLRVAALARLTVPPDRVDALASELDSILDHMEVLKKADVKKSEPVTGVGARSAPLAPDKGTPVSLEIPIADFAPATRDGFLLVPRLDTHDAAERADGAR
jgi:aspartyl-tRNA(Asn)/glutamyl-tRNA(Gln) amidotransferase subunit C